MGAKRDEHADFISGIYNYCDRWCERCPLTHRCLLFHQEAERRAHHYEAETDPDDPAVAAKDVAENLQKTVKVIVEVAEEKGIELAALERELVEEQPESRRSVIRNHPLAQKSHKFAMQSHHFLEKLSTLLHEEQRKAISPDQLNELQDCFEVLSWHHMQIAVKLDRALSGKPESARLQQEYGIDFLNDSDGSAKVAYLGILHCMDALTKVYQWNQPFHLDIMPLLEILYELVSDVDTEFPGHKTFKRPGFDL